MTKTTKPQSTMSGSVLLKMLLAGQHDALTAAEDSQLYPGSFAARAMCVINRATDNPMQSMNPYSIY